MTSGTSGGGLLGGEISLSISDRCLGGGDLSVFPSGFFSAAFSSSSGSDSPAVTASANTNAAMEQEEEAVEEKEDASVEPAHNIESTPVRDQPQPPTPPLFTTEQQQPPEHESPLVQATSLSFLLASSPLPFLLLLLESSITATSR
jgi:hypothetical protein